MHFILLPFITPQKKPKQYTIIYTTVWIVIAFLIYLQCSSPVGLATLDETVISSGIHKACLWNITAFTTGHTELLMSQSSLLLTQRRSSSMGFWELWFHTDVTAFPGNKIAFTYCTIYNIQFINSWNHPIVYSLIKGPNISVPETKTNSS